MSICIFCPSKLGKTTKPEHILHNGLGGRKTTRRAICSACNNRFGSDIDKVLVEQFAILRNLLQLRSGTGEPPPMIKKVKAGKDTITIESDGKLRAVGKPFQIVEKDGIKQLQINGQSLEEIKNNIPHMAAALKITEEELIQKLSKVSAFVEERRPFPFQFRFAFGGSRAVRSAVKSCLVLWSTLVGNDEIKTEKYNYARMFVNGENEDFLSTSTNLDSRIYEQNATLVDKYGPVFSLIYIKSDEQGRVIGHFTALNLIGFQVILVEQGAPANRQIALITDPITGTWSSDIADTLDVPFDWLSSPDYDYETMDRSRQRFDAVMARQVTIGREREVGRIVDSVFKSHGIMEGDLVTSEMVGSISKTIAHRVAHHFVGVPLRTPIPPAEVKEAFGAKS